MQDVVQNPLHPYAKGSMGAIPTLASDASRLVQMSFRLNAAAFRDPAWGESYGAAHSHSIAAGSNGRSRSGTARKPWPAAAAAKDTAA